MGASTQGEVLSQAELMAKGLRKNLAKLAGRGMDEAFVAEFETLRSQAVSLNAEQEALKSRVKELTEKLDRTFAEVKTKMSEAKKVIKLAIPPSGWLEYAITDSK